MDNKKNGLLLNYKYILESYFGDLNLDIFSTFSANKKNFFDINSIKIMSEQIGIIAVEKKITASEIPPHLLPCLIFDTNENSYVLLSPSHNNVVEIYNATDMKKNTINSSELKKFKKALFVTKNPIPYTPKNSLSKNDWLYEPIKSFWRSYIELALLTFFINIFALFVPLFTMIVYDRVVPNQAYETLYVLSFGLIIAIIFEQVFKGARNYIIDNISKKLSIYFEEELMKRMLLLQSQKDTMMTGSKLNLFRELAIVKDFFGTRSIVQLIDFPFFIFALIAIYAILPVMAFIPLTMAIIILSVNILLQLPISKLSSHHMNNNNSKQNYLIETIEAKDTLALSNAIATKLFGWQKIITFTENLHSKINAINSLAVNISHAFVQVTTISVICIGVFEIANKNLSVGGLIAISILSARSIVPIVTLSTAVIKFKEIKNSLSHLEKFWSIPLESDKNSNIGMKKIKGNIEFKNVSFSFANAKKPSLENISFSIKNGEKVGIIGQTGAGKSTLLKLIAALLHPTNGSIFIDKQDIATIHSIELREHLGIMPQEAFLFKGTLKENIEMSKPLSKETISDVITLVGLEDFIKKNSQNDSFIIDEKGSNLSLGQKHLVTLARAIADDPSILILDEPTAGLDVTLERKVISNLKDFIENRTLILITHRFAALELVNRIIVLNDGKIIADGPKDLVLNALHNSSKRG